MTQVITLAAFARAACIEADSIHRQRRRARQHGRPDPFPGVSRPGSGQIALVDVEWAHSWAAARGRKINLDVGDSAR